MLLLLLTFLKALGCVLYKMCYFIGPFEESGNMSIINCKYRIPDKPKYSAKIISMISMLKFCITLSEWILNTDPDKRPDIFDLIKKVSEELGVQSEVKKPTAVPKATTQKQPTPSTPTSKKTPSPAAAQNNNQGGDLFAMLDWQGEGSAPSTNNNTKVPTPTTAHAPEDEWQADFSDFDDSQFAQPQPPKKVTPPTPSKQQAAPPASPSKVVSAKPAHLRQQSLDVKPKKVEQGGDLFAQLDWNEETDSPQSASKIIKSSDNWGDDEEEEKAKTVAKKKTHARSRSDMGKLHEGMEASSLVITFHKQLI